jgi:hypothetical protein
MANIQFEQIKKQFKEQDFYVGDLVKKNPKELQCLGFNVSDLDISFKKSQLQLSLFYKDVTNPDREICDAFEKELIKSPSAIYEQVSKFKPGDMEASLAELKAEAEMDASAKKAKRAADKAAAEEASEEAATEEPKKVIHDEL